MAILPVFNVSLLFCALPAFAAADLVSVIPREDTNAVLHNPDMGWVLYENYPLDRDPHGSSTLLRLPGETFNEVDAVALMFTWQDIEKAPDQYDFSAVDFAYDYWRKRGKSIQLRVSATSLVWWGNRQPPAGLGAPDYVVAGLPPSAKAIRKVDGVPFRVEDARHPFYQERLAKFLRSLGRHFTGAREVSLIDLRGFGAWGEWHTGFPYSTLSDRREALKSIIDLWTEALPNHRLALSYSYDPDGPKELYSGSNRAVDPSVTNYAAFLEYSAFDHAMTKANVTFRRDGCGGAVHTNERRLCDEAFQLGRGPMFSEFLGGYAQALKGGSNWVNWMMEDALSLHPNYINLLGWQSEDALSFIRERRDLVDLGMRRMGYRLVPAKVEYEPRPTAEEPWHVKMTWCNQGVGRALRDFELRLLLVRNDGSIAADETAGTVESSRWRQGELYVCRKSVTWHVSGEFEVAMNLRDRKSGAAIQLPLEKAKNGAGYSFGRVRVEPSRQSPDSAKAGSRILTR